MTAKVWSEFPGRAGFGVDQCSECGYLMGMVHGGFTKFPLGVYTVAERDALTAAEVNREAHRAAGGAMFTIINAAALKRYGKRLRSITADGRANVVELRAALATPGNAVVLPGSYLGLAYNHPLRARARQANGSDYTGGHMVTVLNLAGASKWLDPLRPNGEAAYACTVADAMAFAEGGAFSANYSDAHVVRAGEFATLPDAAMEEEMVDPKIHKPVASVVFKAGTIHRSADRTGTPYGSLATPTRLSVFALPRVLKDDKGRATLVPVLIDTLGGTAVNYVVGYVGVDQIDPATWQQHV